MTPAGDISTFSYAATIGTWCSGLIAPFIGRLADRYGPRLADALRAAHVAGVCFLLLSGVSSVWQFYAAYIVARAVSNKPVLIGLVPRTAAVNFFRRRRNIALALVSTFPSYRRRHKHPANRPHRHQPRRWRDAFRYLGIFKLLPWLSRWCC